MMKPTLCLLLTLTALATPCHARWGMAYEKCVEFYGKAQKEWKDDGVIKKARFRRSDNRRDITITATFADGRCSSISYFCTDNSFMTTETLSAILNAYSDEKLGIKFVPLEMLASFTEEELIAQKDVLKRSIKEQIWILAGKKKSATLYAVFNRDAQMLTIREVKVKEVTKGVKPPAKPKKPMGF